MHIRERLQGGDRGAFYQDWTLIFFFFFLKPEKLFLPALSISFEIVSHDFDYLFVIYIFNI